MANRPMNCRPERRRSFGSYAKTCWKFRCSEKITRRTVPLPTRRNLNAAKTIRLCAQLARLILLSILLLPGLSAATDKDFTIVVDEKLPDEGSTTVWLGY